MKALALLACAGIAAAGCATEPPATRVEGHHVDEPRTADHAELTVAGWVVETVPTTTEPTTTTSTEVARETTTTTEPNIAPPTTARRVTPTTVYDPPAPQGRTTGRGNEPPGNDFWYRLALCESGAGASSPNIFQFMGGTAEKVGYYPGASYEAQRAMAIDWAARIHPGEGTSAGWPVCWWTAGGS